MSDFNPELWGLRFRHMAGLSNPPPPGSDPDLVQAWAAFERARVEGTTSLADLKRELGLSTTPQGSQG